MAKIHQRGMRELGRGGHMVVPLARAERSWTTPRRESPARTWGGDAGLLAALVCGMASRADRHSVQGSGCDHPTPASSRRTVGVPSYPGWALAAVPRE